MKPRRNGRACRIGEQMLVAGAAPARRYTIVGITKFAGGQSFGGASAALLTLAEAQRVAGEQGRYDQIDVAAQPGVTPSELRDRVRAVLPGTIEVRTGAQQAATETSELESNLSFLRTFLLVFAYVALVVGAFIIFNTFSITVAQRTREFGLLRTLGGSRRQIMQSVVFEGLLLGVGGAVLGLLGGIALAPALDQLFKAFGADLPDSGTVLETRTIVVSLLVGIGVTVLAGLNPALRATRVPPLAAMREGVGTRTAAIHRGRRAHPWPGRRGACSRPRSAVGLRGRVRDPVRCPVGLCDRAARPPRRADAAPRHRLVPALARAIGVLVAGAASPGASRAENTIRQPGRTMVTAAALTVGLALVTFVAVLADGTKATIDQAVDRSFAGDLIVENSSVNSEAAIPALVAPALRRIPGVASVTPIAFTVGRLHGISGDASITAIEPEHVRACLQGGMEAGLERDPAGTRRRRHGR